MSASTEAPLLHSTDSSHETPLPPHSTSPSIVEPSYTPAVKAQLDALRASIISTLDKHGAHYSPDAKWPAKQLHWRDVYQQHRHSTSVHITPDPRLTPGYTPPCLQRTWPDWHLHRYLVARRHNIHDATVMFVNMLAWRVSFGVDDLASQPQCPWSDIRASLIPEKVHFVDKEGRPLYIACYGPIDTDKVLSSLTIDMMYVLETYRLEYNARLEEQSSAQVHRRVTQISVILDAKGCTLHHRHLMKWVDANNHVGQNHYPEFLYQLFIVNIPSFFPTLWNVVKLMLDERVRQKINLLGSHYQEELCAKIGAAQLPREWGGQCDRCGGHCLPVVDVKDVEAERAKVKAAIDQFFSPPHTHETLHLHARQTHTLTIPVKATADPQSVTVWWRVGVAHKDVDVSVHFQPAKGGKEECIVGVTKVHSGAGYEGLHQLVVTGADEAGEVHILVSNAASMMTGKTVTVDCGLHSEAVVTSS